MSKTKTSKKPGIKDIVAVTTSLVQEVQFLHKQITELYGIIDLYFEFNKDGDKFKEYLDNKLKEFNDEQEQNAHVDAGYSEPSVPHEG